MAKYFDLLERAGRLVRVYESGLELDDQTGRILKPAAGTLITREKATDLHRQRRKKTAALLRQRIASEHSAAMPNPANTAAEAFADSGGMLYSQVVLNSEAYPRDRKEMWEMLGKYSEVLPADVRQPDAGPEAARLQALTAAASVETARILERVFRDVKAEQEQQARQTVEGKVVE